MFWEIVGGSIAYVITGLIMWFPEIFGRWPIAISYVIHDISALIMLAASSFTFTSARSASPAPCRP
jgi:cytochrome b subunit of formate dehydrogenase